MPSIQIDISAETAHAIAELAERCTTARSRLKLFLPC